MARVIQLFLFMSGVNTLLQTLAGTRLPTVMNASLAFVVPVLSIARQFDPNDFASNHQVPWLLISPTITFGWNCMLIQVLCWVLGFFGLDNSI
jgi:xanthine/uracil permease